MNLFVLEPPKNSTLLLNHSTKDCLHYWVPYGLKTTQPRAEIQPHYKLKSFICSACTEHLVLPPQIYRILGKTVVCYPIVFDLSDFYMSQDVMLLIDDIQVKKKKLHFISSPAEYNI